MNRQRVMVHERKGWLLALVERAGYENAYNGEFVWPEVIAVVAYDQGSIEEVRLSNVRYQGEPTEHEFEVRT